LDEKRYLQQKLEEKGLKDREEQPEPQRRKDKWPRREMFDNSNGLQALSSIKVAKSGERIEELGWWNGRIEMTAIAIIASVSPGRGGFPKGHFPLD